MGPHFPTLHSGRGPNSPPFVPRLPFGRPLRYASGYGESGCRPTASVFVGYARRPSRAPGSSLRRRRCGAASRTAALFGLAEAVSFLRYRYVTRQPQPALRRLSAGRSRRAPFRSSRRCRAVPLSSRLTASARLAFPLRRRTAAVAAVARFGRLLRFPRNAGHSSLRRKPLRCRLALATDFSANPLFATASREKSGHTIAKKT